MSSPKISVIMPVYNAQQFLAGAISSILTQSFTDLELVLIDDGSTDNSSTILSEFAAKDLRIKLIKNQQNLGLTASLNIAIQNSKGKYIARMDSDDVSLQDRLQKQYEFLEANSNVFLCGTFAQVIDANDKLLNIMSMPTSDLELRNKLEENNCIIHPTIMFRSQPVMTYRPKFGHVEDYDLYLRAITSGLKLAVLPEVLLEYRVISTSITRQKFVEQSFLKDKVLEFYYQRQSVGFDQYSSFELVEISEEIRNNPQKVAAASIVNTYNQHNRFAVIKLVFRFILTYGYDSKVIQYGIASVLPQWLVKLMKRLQK